MSTKRLSQITTGLVLLMLAILLAGCGGGTVKKYTEANSGSTIELKAGDEINIVLESNETTGFVWSQADGMDTRVIEKVSDQYYASTSNRVGAPGEHTWIFKALQQGETKIKLNLGKPWETDVVPLKALTYTIKVT